MKQSTLMPAIFAGGLPLGLIGGGALLSFGVPALVGMAISFAVGTWAAGALLRKI